MLPRDAALVELSMYLDAPFTHAVDSEERAEGLDFAARLVTRVRELHEAAGRFPPWSGRRPE